ncbi:hypothetical protein, partial [uncultured Zhongshania sp.]|uniref:hypothetical protein n=1 Tax=uncultured Zhongshania sp. TaxID=1642288 RepID=UPI0030D72D80
MPNVKAYMKGFESQIPFATAVGLTRTSKAAQGDLTNSIGSVFDRPTARTKSAVFSTSANKRNLRAQIGIKDKASGGRAPADYLSAQILGGRRKAKGLERALQSRGLMRKGQMLAPRRDTKLNRYGNISKAQARAVINSIDSGGTGRGRKYVVKAGEGVYWRKGKGLKGFLNIIDEPTYQSRFDF